MQQFTIGFIAGVLAAAAVCCLCIFTTRRLKNASNQRNQHCELEELSRLTGALAHELKNPLSTIKVNLKLAAEDLTAGSGDIQQRQARTLRRIDIIRKESDRLEQTLDSFLKYVKKTEPQLAAADINELVGDMIDFYIPQSRDNKVTLRQSFSKDALICMVDSAMIKQVILNLLINAHQAMEGGGELMIKTEKQDKSAVIYLSDTGSGIAPDKLPHIFDAYYSSKLHGNGLGLAIAKKIIESHNGSIAVDSELQKGTLFTIRLPLWTE